MRVFQVFHPFFHSLCISWFTHRYLRWLSCACKSSLGGLFGEPFPGNFPQGQFFPEFPATFTVIVVVEFGFELVEFPVAGRVRTGNFSYFLQVGHRAIRFPDGVVNERSLVEHSLHKSVSVLHVGTEPTTSGSSTRPSILAISRSSRETCL